MRVLLLTPPMTQLNTPYPATAYLTGFLKRRGVEVRQADPGLELVLALFSEKGLSEMEALLRKQAPPGTRVESVENFLRRAERYRLAVGPVIRFLQGKDPSLALRIAGREFLPEGPRFRALEQDPSGEDPLLFAFGNLGVQDRAKYLASLFLDDLADMIREGIDPKFEFTRYGEKLAASAPLFDPILRALEGPGTLVDQVLDRITRELLQRHQPDVLALSVPFPGNVYGAFRIARLAKKEFPQTKILLGGGYVNTELRDLTDPRIFDFVDFLTFDDGERPILNLLEYFQGARPAEKLHRTMFRAGGKIVLQNDPLSHDIPHKEVGAPSYEGLKLGEYLSIFEMLNPMHRIWSDGRWNKLTLAHGCYWRKCGFCDVTLDYIGRYDTAAADELVNRMETVIRETGQSGFHFVDEAAPPAVLRALAERILERGLVVSWWGNIRFEKTFTPELTALLARSGCIAVSGGLEVASDRLLKLMNKGVSVEQVARVTRAFADAGILVHAYLMYGFPTQTGQETVDSLERVRQLFQQGCLHSAYWHRFSATAHSPIGQNPGKYGIELLPEPLEEISRKGRFARNDLQFRDPVDCDHEFLGEGLKRGLYNFMHGAGLDLDVRHWFGRKVPKAKVAKSLIRSALGQ